MTISYWLFIVFAGNMQIAGPFHGLPACEKAAAQVRVVASENVLKVGAGTVCLSQKHVNFKYKEPKK